MRKIFIAMFLALMPYAAANAIMADDPYLNLVESFSYMNESSGDCNNDECYDSGSGACYYVGMAIDYLDETCGIFCETRGLSVVYDGKEVVGCGCLLKPQEDWRASGTGRERKYTITPTDCNGGETTSATNEYRCAAGYYGAGSTSSLSCSRCPGMRNTAGVMIYGNSAAGATKITECELPVGTYQDATGTFKLTAPCPYK